MTDKISDDYVVVRKDQLQALLTEKRSVVAGDLVIVQMPDGTHWIGQKEGGEGGQFKDFPAMVKQFYEENF